MDRRGEGVVAGLARVDVIVRVDLGAELAGRDGGQHLVGVHVRGCAGAGLEHVDRELRVELTLGHPISRRDDTVGQFGVDHAQFGVDHRGRRLDLRERVHKRRRQRLPGDREVLHSTLGLRPPQCVAGHLDLAHRVVLDPVLHVVTHTSRVRRSDR
jgi:hypothetical protein